ncbi:MAG: nascent polypeptide-associated complex protein [archaeon]
MLPSIAGMNPKQMQGLMKQFGIKSTELNAKRAIFELEDGRKLVIEKPGITLVDAQGQKIYTVTGEAVESKGEEGIPEEDIALVAEQAKVSKEKARKCLEKNKGDIAEAIAELESN